jgi:hypothetical protein
MKWEYLVTKYVGGKYGEHAGLDQHGNEGWELVAVVALPMGSGDTLESGWRIKHYWKRPKP